LRIVIFCHSLISDWNHGNAHFLRGVAGELLARGHEVRVFEPWHAWSLVNLVRDAGPSAVDDFHTAYPRLRSTRYSPAHLDLDQALDRADLVLVHEWNSHDIVARIGRHRANSGRYVLLFHDTHHRSVTDSAAMARYDLQHYDGVLAFGEVIREQYLRNGWSHRAWTWHEAADVNVFRPLESGPERPDGDLVWIGNWGDGERSGEIRDYLKVPAAALGLRTRAYGVRYPVAAVTELNDAGIAYGGWLPNYKVPEVFARYVATTHIPRRPYVEALPGIPTIRVFEALACGIPLVSCWWDDCERLFRPGADYLVARSPTEMKLALRSVTNDAALRRSLTASGRETILRRHTCAHRVDELLGLVGSIKAPAVERMASA
jgi:spore maturation protein CgeB